MRNLIFSIAILASTGCTSTRPATAQDLIVELMTVWETGDAERLSELMARDVVYDDVPNNRSLSGIDQSAAYVTHIHTWASDVEVSVDRVFSTNSDAAAEWTMKAFQTAPIPGRIPVATGAPVTIKGMTVVHVDDGRIVRAADYMDVLGFVLQLGAEVTLPGGVTLGPQEAAAGKDDN